MLRERKLREELSCLESKTNADPWMFHPNQHRSDAPIVLSVRHQKVRLAPVIHEHCCKSRLNLIANSKGKVKPFVELRVIQRKVRTQLRTRDALRKSHIVRVRSRRSPNSVTTRAEINHRQSRRFRIRNPVPNNPNFLRIRVPLKTRLQARRKAVRDRSSPLCPWHVYVNKSTTDSPLII
jgi:hypothetical protein